MRHKAISTLALFSFVLAACGSGTDDTDAATGGAGAAGVGGAGAAGVGGGAAGVGGAGAGGVGGAGASGVGGAGAAGVGGAGAAGVGGAGAAGVGGAGAAGATTAPKPGSYALDLQATPLPKPGGCPVTPLPSPGRLDLRLVDTGVEAIVSFPFQPPTAMAVSLDGGVLTLTGVVQGEEHLQPMNNWYLTWEALQVTLGSDGTPGSVAGTGSLHKSDGGDNHCDSKVVASGSAVADTTPPQTRIELELRRGPTSMLPWDKLLLGVSEPVQPAALTADVTVSRNGSPLSQHPTTPLPAASAPDGWAGAVTSTFGWSTGLPWDQLRGATLGFDVTAADPSGNPSGPVSTSFQIADPGPVVASQGFDTDGAVATFGNVKHVSSGAPCETGGCIDLGLINGNCASEQRGVALRVGAAGATKLHARIRLSAPSAIPKNAMTIRVTPTDPALKSLLVPAGGYPSTPSPDGVTTDWTDVTIPLPAGWPVEDLGVLVAPGSTELKPNCVFFPSFAPIRIVLDRVWVD